MANHGKKYKEAKKLFDGSKFYTVEEAVELARKTNTAKFDATVEIAIKTFANPKFNDQMIRSTTVLPHWNGKTQRIAAFVTEDMKDQAIKAGADVVWFQDLLKDIGEWKLDFDVLVTTPENLRELAKVAKSLGPKGLMPSPKAGTVAIDVLAAIQEIKKWKIEFRLDKTGNIHASMGKISFGNEKLVENIHSFMKAVEAAKPVWVKAKLFKKIALATTMGPWILIAC